METMVKSFQAMTPDLQVRAGGKGGMLVKLFQNGYPVPEGFAIFSSAFEGEHLQRLAWDEIQAALSALRSHHKGALFAVRSSAAQEDSASASYAGAFETVLNVKTDQEIENAIITVFRSRLSERVQVYSSAQGMEHVKPIAVVVQVMVQASFSGVLFTADPITGSFTAMVGNYVPGLGEKLVSGEVDASSFRLIRPKGNYDGPETLRKYAVKLYKYAARLERELGCPQDIEWAVAKGKVYLLQARPITTLSAGNLDTYAINESLAEDALWVNTNVGESIPDVMTPLSWSLIRALDNESLVVPGYYAWSGNICGRSYSTMSQSLSAMMDVYGKNVGRSVRQLLDEVFGHIPEQIALPLHPFSRGQMLKLMIPRILYLIRNMQSASKRMPDFLANTLAESRRIREKLRSATTSRELLAIWKQDLQPAMKRAWWGLVVGTNNGMRALSVKKKLTELVGIEDANTLLSHLRGNAELASLGLVVGIAQIVKGEIGEEDFVRQHGHRSPHEFELSLPDHSIFISNFATTIP